MENTEKFRMRRYSKKTATNIYAAPMCGVNDKQSSDREEGYSLAHNKHYNNYSSMAHRPKE